MTPLSHRSRFGGFAVPLLVGLLASSAPIAAFAQDAAAPAIPSAAQNAAADGTAAPSSSSSQAPVVAAPSVNAAPEAAPIAPSPVVTEKSADNPYGLSALWANGDIIARGVLIIMLLMSIGSWYIIITKFVEQARLLSSAKAAAKNFWSHRTLQEGAASLKTTSPFRYVAETAITAAEHHEGTMQDSIDLSDWTSAQIQRSVDTVQSNLQSGLAFLGTVGSTSPFVGLFGTVWGIYHALTAIGIAGQASIDKVAGPVGESLIMTAIGLGTAVPAVLGYNLLVRRNKNALERVRNFASDVQSILIGGFRHGATRETIVVRPDRSPTTATASARVA
ncbi:MotA/TolQ/ExbB proton channel family protein [Acetobacter estunensis]|uniref:MotA/TolQ/ExbB proton channel family protein n=1 Tax=Acetobacter estunensis TaxID=104097 RepID=UPI001C2D2D6E|nr:MotA/TolQ/ExbB proton channel family protein [Acetobacter estunensis]MBV1836648.1 MotA/TolQ/ExbB proton channel family protein [Acetobacter estunensis]